MSTSDPLVVGSYIWDGANSKVGVVDALGDDTVHYRATVVGGLRPTEHWTFNDDVTVLTGPILDGKTTLMERLIADLISGGGTFSRVGVDIVWRDFGGYTYRLDLSGILPGISQEELQWR